jgi:hypothetical protein
MIILGVRLATVKFAELFKRPFVYIACVGKLIIFPLFCYLAVCFLPLDLPFKASILILSGTGTVLCNEDESGIENARRETLAPGDCHYCPRGAYHSLRNDAEEDLVFFAIVPQQ